MKMNKPELSVVRFSAEDVIATSGAIKVGYSLPKKSGYVDYAVLKTEAEEAGLTFINPDPIWQWFRYEDGKITRGPNPYVNGAYGTDFYAFYDEGQWWTEGKQISQYVNNDGLSNTTAAGWRTTRTQ